MGKTKEYNHAYYSEHAPGVIARLKDRVKSRREAVRKAKDNPCADCGIKYPYWVMQFDHVRGKKEFNIGQKMWNAGLKRVLEEIAKCEVVCSNCHATRSYYRQFPTGKVV